MATNGKHYNESVRLMSTLGVAVRPMRKKLKSMLAPVAMLIPCATVAPTHASGEAQPLTVADAIETARFASNQRAESVFISPDGSRYVTMIIRGDIKNDGVRMEILSGELSSLDAAKPRQITSLVTHALPSAIAVTGQVLGPSALLAPGANAPMWLDDDNVAFLWTDEYGKNQIFDLNLLSSQLKQLTREKSGVVSFTFGPHGSLAYDVNVDFSLERSLELVHTGYPVKSPDAVTLLSGIVDGTNFYDLTMCQRAVAVEADGAYVARPVPDSKIKCEISQMYWDTNIISPDGRRLIINTQVSKLSDDWSAYQGDFAPHFKDAKENPRGFLASSVTEFTIVDLASGARRPLWAVPASSDTLFRVAWSPDSSNVLIGPTMLPVGDSDPDGLVGRAVAIVDVETGRYQKIPLDPQLAAGFVSTKWTSAQDIVLALFDGRSLDFAYTNGHWQRVNVDRGSTLKGESKIQTASTAVKVQQDMNHPPVLVATDLQTGRSRVVFDPNPDLLTRFELGRVDLTQWSDTAGHRWEGRLYYPAHYRAGVRYPLVIQTHGYANKNQFSLYGQGSPGAPPMGPGWSVYLAQPLASRDIAVLQIGGPIDAMISQETDFEGTMNRG
jgi:hypothetical protein